MTGDPFLVSGWLQPSGGDLILAQAEARGKVRDALIEPELNVREDFTITEKALTRHVATEAGPIL